MNAPAPDTFFDVKFTVSGPLPLLPVSAVQIRLSPALNPLRPARFQLHRVSGHTTATRLCGPDSVTEPVKPWVEVKLGVAVKSVASAPSCDHTMVSLALKPPRLVTTATLSARAAAVASRIRTIAALSPRNVRLCIDGPFISFDCLSVLTKVYGQARTTGPASLVKVLLLENVLSTAIEGLP